MLELQDLTKIYNAGTVTEMTLFDHFNLTVPDGQFVSIVGSNGSGKTSLLNILCGSIPLDGGDVLLDGKSIRKQKDYQRYAIMGRVYQNPSLGTSPNLTMLENLSLADNKGKPFGLGFGVNKKRIDFYRSELASLGLGLEDKLDVKMGALSGGQRQAVALLMATMTPLKFLILDEHTAALDPKTAETIMVLTGKAADAGPRQDRPGPGRGGKGRHLHRGAAGHLQPLQRDVSEQKKQTKIPRTVGCGGHFLWMSDPRS